LVSEISRGVGTLTNKLLILILTTLSSQLALADISIFSNDERIPKGPFLFSGRIIQHTYDYDAHDASVTLNVSVQEKSGHSFYIKLSEKDLIWGTQLRIGLHAVVSRMKITGRRRSQEIYRILVQEQAVF
jgi:hypothetical protein